MNGSPKTSVNTVLTPERGKIRVYLQKTGYAREIPGSASMPRAPYSQGPAPPAARTACSSTRTAPCALATSAKGSIGALRQARLAGVAVRTMRSCRHQAPPWPGGSTGESTRWRSGRAPSLRTPLALYASRQGLPQKYSPSSGIHTISHATHECTGSLHCLQLCAAAFWCSKTSLHAAQANGPSCCRSSRCGQSQHRPASAWACAV